MSMIVIKDLETKAALGRREMGNVKGGMGFCGTRPGPGKPDIFDIRIEDIISNWPVSVDHDVERVYPEQDPFAPGGPLQGPF
jgi:hypothetical protein